MATRRFSNTKLAGKAFSRAGDALDAIGKSTGSNFVASLSLDGENKFKGDEAKGWSEIMSAMSEVIAQSVSAKVELVGSEVRETDPTDPAILKEKGNVHFK